MPECKRCSRCGEPKPLDEYRMLKSGRRTSHCKSCAKEYLAAWRIKNVDRLNEQRKQRYVTPEARARKRQLCNESYARNSDSQRNGRLLKMFGITLAEYTAMSVAQGGLCAICKKTCLTGRNLAVDHDHVTGNVRALLCANCNRGLGLFQDQPDLLAAALSYLIEHQPSRTTRMPLKEKRQWPTPRTSRPEPRTTPAQAPSRT